MKTAILAAAAAATAAAQVRLPDYTRHVLPNGVVIAVMPRQDVPLVTMRVAVKGGVESEPRDLAGLATITADLLQRGTKARSAARFADELDSLGAVYTAEVNHQASIISIEALSKDFDAALELLVDSIRNPVFVDDEVRKKGAQRVDMARSVKDNPGAAAAAYFRSVFFGPDHPYGRPADELSYARITRRDVAAYHARMYTGKNVIVAVAGTFDPDAARPKLTRAFSELPGGTAYHWKQAPDLQPPPSRLTIIDKPSASQTHFILAKPGISRAHPDRIPLWVVNTAYGGRFTSILNDELRVNSGLTYGAFSRFDTSHLPGGIYVQSFTQTDTTVKALDLALATMKRLVERGLTKDLLDSSKAYIKGTYPPDRLETSDQLASVLLELELHDLTRSEVDDLFAKIDAVTLDEANAIARKYYDPKAVTMMLLGNAKAFRELVKTYAASRQEQSISLPGLRVPPVASETPGAIPAPSQIRTVPPR